MTAARDLESVLAARYLARIERTPTCWNWIGIINDSGYGTISAGKDKPTKAHRFVYTELVGPIPDGLDLDHLCRNPRCVNPDHLEPVTRTENLRRQFVSRRLERLEEIDPAKVTIRPFGPTRRADGIPNARKTHCPKGHPYDAENTMFINGGGCRRCLTCRRQQVRDAQRRRRARIVLDWAAATDALREQEADE